MGSLSFRVLHSIIVNLLANTHVVETFFEELTIFVSTNMLLNLNFHRPTCIQLTSTS